MSVIALGLNHHTAPLDLRGRFAFAPEQLTPSLQALRDALAGLPDQPWPSRTAFFKAVYDGHRDFTAIAVCGGKDGVLTGKFPPCGVCRQVMREFCPDDFPIYLVGAEGSYEKVTLAELRPHSFSAATHMI